MDLKLPIGRALAAELYGPARASVSAEPPYLSGEGARARAHRAAFAFLDWALPESPERLSAGPAARLDALSRELLALQREDGTTDSGNLRSPPDTAFVCETLETLLRLAEAASTASATASGERGRSAGAETEPLRAALDRITLFCDRAADMLAVSGVHTPNHRWVVCGALAQAYKRTGRAAYRERCLDWLGEGIDLDADGQFSERSSGIYSPVTCMSLIRMADGLGMPELLGAARRCLEATLFLVQPGGEVETVASRRQDQAQTARLSRQAFPYAYLAALDGDPRFAWAARQGLARPAEAMEQLPAFLAYAPGGGTGDWSLPEASEPVEEYEAFFARAGLVRRRSGATAISLYGGTDIALDPALPDASGIASNPSVLAYRVGAAACRWLRFRPLHFDLPAARFRLESYEGGRAVLSWSRTVPYFGPLPRASRRPDGDYGLSTGDGRFWSKLSFAERPRLNECSLGSRLVARLGADRVRIEVEAEANVRTPALLELAFDAECQVRTLDGGAGLAVSRGGDSFRVLSEGPASWREVTGSPAGESGRHSTMRDGEGEAKALLRWALEFEAPCRLSLAFGP